MKKAIQNLLVLAIVVTASPVWAAKTKAGAKTPEVFPPAMPISYQGPTPEEAREAKEELAKYLDQKAEKRKIAGLVNPTQNDLSQKEEFQDKSFEHFRDEFFKISTPEQLDAMLSPYENIENFKQLPIDVQFVVNQLLLLRPMRGILPRTENIFKTVKTPMSHAIYVKVMKDFAAKSELYFPSEEWRAGFRYVMEPHPDQAGNPLFAKVSDFQNFLTGPMTRALEAAVQRTQIMYAKLRDPKSRDVTSGEFAFDRQLVFGVGSFASDLDRVRSVGRGELMIQMVYLKRALYLTHFFSAFNMDKFAVIQNELEALKSAGEFGDSVLEKSNFALQLATNFEAVGFSERQKARILRRHTDFMQRRGLNGPKDWKIDANSEGDEYGVYLMKKSWRYLTEVIQHRKNAWNLLKARDDRPTQFFNAAVLKDDPRAVEACISDADRMINTSGGWAEVRSVVTGDAVRVNLQGFFNKPPETMQDFLPTDFEVEPKPGASRFPTKNGVKYRNYFYGRAVAWDMQKISPFIMLDKAPNMPNKLSSAFTIASQSWGGGMINYGLYFFVK